LPDDKPKPLIPARVLLVGENAIPREVLDRLTDEQMQLFLREPDPTRWPPEMAVLVRFLSEEERLKLDVQAACCRHEAELGECFERWTLAVRKELARKELTSMPAASLIVDEMAGYLKALMKTYLEKEIPS
jgi:hypothetical protein